MTRDHNLLFGVFAVQLGKVSAIQIMDVAAAWALDTSRDLPSRLLELNLLSEQDRSLLELFVNEAVAAHDGDASKTLASFGGEEQVHQVYRGSIVLTADGQVSIPPTARTPESDTPDARPDDVSTVKGVFETPGRYTNSIEHARGGMGRVLLVHDDFLGRDIALKELLPHLGTTEGTTQDGNTSTVEGRPSPVRFSAHIIARFLQEARITGQLEHPSIVPVYELGHRKDGSLYYTMKLVRGRSLAKAIKECNNLEERLRLLPHFVDLCQAIAYAHSREIIHRDIKPANVMVGEFGETVVLDWGLAKKRDRKDFHERELEKTLHAMNLGNEVEAARTAYGQVVGTPAYMAPEQARGALEDVDELSDVYSLGVVLYEILTGRIPFEGKSTRELLNKVIAGKIVPVEDVEDDAPPELVAIAAKAMGKEKGDRYANVRALAEEVEHFQSGALVSAYAYKRMDLLTRFVQRHRALVLTTSVALLLLAVVTTFYAVRITQTQSRLIEETRRAEYERTAAESERLRAAEAEFDAKQQEARSYTARIQMAQSIMKDDPEGAQTLLLDTGLASRGWEWSYLMKSTLSSSASQKKNALHLGDSNFSIYWEEANGSRVLLVSEDGQEVRLWDLQSKTLLANLNFDQPIVAGNVSNNGKFGAGRLADNSLILWNLENMDESQPIEFERAQDVYVVHVNDAGTAVILGASTNTNWSGKRTFYYGSKTDGWHWKELGRPDTEHLGCEISPHWSRLAIENADSSLDVYRIPDGKHLFRHTDPVRELTFGPNGENLYIESPHETPMDIQILDANNGSVKFPLTASFVRRPSVRTFSPSGQYFFASSFRDGGLFFDMNTGRVVDKLHLTRILEANMNIDESRLAIMTGEGHVRSFELSHYEHGSYLIEDKIFTPNRLQSVLQLSSSGEGVFLREKNDLYHMPLEDDAHNPGTLETIPIQHASNEIDTSLLSSEDPEPFVYALSNDGEFLASVAKDGTVEVTDLSNGESLENTDSNATLLGPLGFFKDGTLYFTNSSGIHRWKFQDGLLEALLPLPEKRIQRWTSNSGSQRIALLLTGDELIAYDRDTETTWLPQVYTETAEIALSLSGTYLAAGKARGNEIEVSIFDWDSDTAAYSLTAPGASLKAIDFSPNNKRLAAIVDESMIYVWDLETKQILYTITSPAFGMWGMMYTPRGDRILTVSADGFNIWHAESGSYLVRLDNLRGLRDLRLNNSGTRMAGTLHVSWNDNTTKRPVLLRLLPWWKDAILDEKHRDEMVEYAQKQDPQHIQTNIAAVDTENAILAFQSVFGKLDVSSDQQESEKAIWLPDTGVYATAPVSLREKTILPAGTVITRWEAVGVPEYADNPVWETRSQNGTPSDGKTAFVDIVGSTLESIQLGNATALNIEYLHPPYLRVRNTVEFGTDSISTPRIAFGFDGNEERAVERLLEIVRAEMSFRRDNNSFTAAFADLTAATPPYLDGDWAVVKDGYNFVLGGDANNFTANADPATMGKTGGRGFFVDSSGVVRYADGASANALSPPVFE